jgi:hypothetical protein
MATLAVDHGTDDPTPEPSREADDHGGLATAAELAPRGAEDRETEPESVEENVGGDSADDGPDEPTTNTAPDDEAEATVPAAAPGQADPTEPDPGPETGQAAVSDDLPDTAENDDEPTPPTGAPGSAPNAGAEAEEIAPAAEAEPGPARLGKGELRAQVEDHLRAHPDQTWTPTAISKILNRSAGAINNACVKLSEAGTVMAFTDKPVRFQWNGENGTAKS